MSKDEWSRLRLQERLVELRLLDPRGCERVEGGEEHFVLLERLARVVSRVGARLYAATPTTFGDDPAVIAMIDDVEALVVPWS